MKKVIIGTGAAVLILALAGYFIFIRGSGRKYDFRLDKVSQGDLTAFVTATGTINAVTSVDVGTQVSGIVSKMYADFNSVVKAGQIIAQIDSTFLVQSVKDADASLSKAKAQYADSKRNLEREKTLYDRGLESQLNYETALTTYESNDAALKSAQASLDRAKINLSYATIYAPINGVVINRAVSVGQTVAASFSSPTLFTIANDLRKMQVQTTVDESDIGMISIGQGSTFTVDAYPDERFNGVVSQIRLAPVTIQNVVNYTVIIDVDNDQLKLMPGMTANVKIQVADAHGVLRVPNMALRFQPPPDLIDSSKIQGMRSMLARGGGGEDSTRGSLMADPPLDSANRGGAGNGGRERFAAMRDSIQKAHGGSLSPDELRAEMQNVFAARKALQKAPASGIKPLNQRKASTPVFGIDNRYPEYEKSVYVPEHQAGRARLWILGANGKLEPVFVRTGVTDGRFTEITSSQLKPGDQIVLGATANGEAAADARSPFGPGQRMGGMR